MEISAKYNPSLVEDKWYEYWLKNKLFHSEPNEKEAYTLVIAPPNVTGILHMGHVLNNTLNDVLLRKARLDGKNACWVPGTDHASIATESKVVARLKERGISKEELSREEFLKYAWEWKEEYGGIILKQLRKLGASCDWDRTRFTMEPGLSEAVVRAFVHFYEKGMIYRGVRMVNWDPEGHTAVSDEEVIHKETKSKLYYIKYFLSQGEREQAKKDYIVIATTRPETIMADAAISINPSDERYFHLRDRKVLIPLIDREIPVILDDYVEKDFGTGCLKVTPAHDVNDYEIGLRHNLPIIDTIDDNGCLNEKAQILIGEDRFTARKKIVKMLEEQGHIEKIEEYLSPVGYSERTNAVIEPKLSTQWFLKMNELATKALESIESGAVRLIPDKYRASYKHWMENVRDWCISRQLWWGQRIPAYYLPDGSYVVAETFEKALEKAKAIRPEITPSQLRQDEDVLDTWFSSWLWPISVFDPEAVGIEDKLASSCHNDDLKYYYPVNDLVTAPDILFFWVARMIMAGNEFMGEVPFRNVYLTGIVRDKQGRKMSKTLGNSPDPLDLIDRYGADAVRIGMLLCSSAGNDIFYDESQIEQGRNFCNKIWNSYRLIKGWKVDEKLQLSSLNLTTLSWFENKLASTIELVEEHYSKFRISDALMAVYKLFWDDYCSWYLELIKPEYAKSIDKHSYEKTLDFFEALLKLIHPVMPFITEEIWQDLKERKEGESIMYSGAPKFADKLISETSLQEFEVAKGVINNIRGIRQKREISPKEALTIELIGDFPEDMVELIKKLANISEVTLVRDSASDDTENKERQGISFMVGTLKVFVPLSIQVNVEEEISKTEAALAYQRKFLESVQKKLSNANFVDNAPAKVVELERKKEADSRTKIAAYETLLKSYKNR